jgi:ABC-type dipeptide/oligopeptide/nickel transport system ATPase component
LIVREQPFLSLCLTAGYRNKPPVLRSTFLQMRQGEILGLIGQSGSGKSTMALAILRLLELKGGWAEGSVYLEGNDLMKLKERELRALRGKQIGLVLQSPLSSLNPALRIGTQLREAWRAHANGPSSDCQAAIVAALSNVSLPGDEDFLRRHPSQLSVGQAQRVLIAMAVLHRPALLIADEPTSALDVITQSEILGLFARLNRELGTAMLYISHDLLSVASICHRIAILHEGDIVECASTEKILESPQHPYTQKLIGALPATPSRTEAGRDGDPGPQTPAPRATDKTTPAVVYEEAQPFARRR